MAVSGTQPKPRFLSPNKCPDRQMEDWREPLPSADASSKVVWDQSELGPELLLCPLLGVGLRCHRAQ